MHNRVHPMKLQSEGDLDRRLTQLTDQLAALDVERDLYNASQRLFDEALANMTRRSPGTKLATVVHHDNRARLAAIQLVA